MSELQQAVILCGGLGTRLRPYTNSLPKPMVPINGRPFLEFLVEQLREQGIKNILLLTGYLGEKIFDHFQDGRRFGVNIAYSKGPAEWETSRRIWEARKLLKPQFMLLYSDNFIPFRLDRLLAFHQERGHPVSLLLNVKAGGNIRVGANGTVKQYDSSRTALGLDHVEIGYMVIERDPVLKMIDAADTSFSWILERLAERGILAGLVCGDQYHSISDRIRWMRTERYLTPKRILLIDRDGTINVRPQRAEYVHRFEDFRFAPGALEGLTALGRAGFSFIIISNQAGIARNIVSQAAVDDVNQALHEALQMHGVELLQCYICPHHWDDKCACRKPAPGLFFQASRDHLVRLDRTIFIGDDPRDCLAADNANCHCLYVGDRLELGSLPAHVRPDYSANSILESVPWIVSRCESWERA